MAIKLHPKAKDFFGNPIQIDTERGMFYSPYLKSHFRRTWSLVAAEREAYEEEQKARITPFHKKYVKLSVVQDGKIFNTEAFIVRLVANSVAFETPFDALVGKEHHSAHFWDVKGIKESTRSTFKSEVETLRRKFALH